MLTRLNTLAPPPVMLLGSVPLMDVQAVFTAAARAIGPRMKRWPDGETGARRNWIGCQHAVFAAVAELIPAAAKERDYQLHVPFAVRSGVALKSTLESIVFGPLGYAESALASYQVFRTQKRAGVLPPDARFLVALPSPWAPVYSFIAYRWQQAIYPIYAQALLNEVAAITGAIPPDELTIQWDVATEMSWWERVYPAPFDDVESGIIDALAAVCAAVPPAVELGLHLCYGSMANTRWKEPVDLANCVAITNRLSEQLTRALGYVHMPVPSNRRDPGYFAPLADLVLAPGCELYLGLLHLADALPGALARIEVARRFAPQFGLACECGLGRYQPEVIPAWLELHGAAADAAAPLFQYFPEEPHP